MCLGKWATQAYDIVDARNTGHMAKTQSSHAYIRGLFDAVGKTATPYSKPIMRESEGGRNDMLDHVCAILHRSSRVTSFCHFAGAMSGGGRWPGMPGLVWHVRLGRADSTGWAPRAEAHNSVITEKSSTLPLCR